MARHSAPTLPSRARRRAAVAAGAIATTAALSVNTPVVANAAETSSSDYNGNPIDISNVLKQSPQTLIGLLPTVPGALPLVLIPAVQGQIAQGVTSWNGSPLGALFPATNSTTEPGALTDPMPGALDFDAPHVPNTRDWIGQIIHQKNGVTAPLGLGSLNNDLYGGLLFTYDDVFTMSDVAGNGDLSVLVDKNIGGLVGNKTEIAGPLGSALNTDFWLTSSRTNGVTTLAPGAKIDAIAPLGLGNAVFTFSPGSLQFGEGTFILTGPSLGLDLSAFGLGGSFNLTTGSLGVQNGDLVLNTPTIGAGVTTPAGSASVGTSAGSASVGLDGASVTGPTATLSTGNETTTTTTTLSTGSAGVGTSGIEVEPPSVSTTSSPTADEDSVSSTSSPSESTSTSSSSAADDAEDTESSSTASDETESASDETDSPSASTDSEESAASDSPAESASAA